MTDKHINMRAHEVRALLDGQKVQHRVILKDQETWNRAEAIVKRFPEQKSGLPYAVGGRLWCRESFVSLDEDKIAYVASNAPNAAKDYDIREAGFKIRPSIHMPRSASRLTLIIEDVKVERLQDISEEDAIAEGIREVAGFFQADKADGMTAGATSARAAYALLWDSLNAKRAPWSSNPFVAAIRFLVLKENIDTVEGET